MAFHLHNALLVNSVCAIQLIGRKRMLVDFTEEPFSIKGTLGLLRSNPTHPCPLPSVPLILRHRRLVLIRATGGCIPAANVAVYSPFCRG